MEGVIGPGVLSGNVKQGLEFREETKESGDGILKAQGWLRSLREE